MTFFPDSVRKAFIVTLTVLIAATALPLLLFIGEERRHALEVAVEAAENALILQASHMNRWFEQDMMERVRNAADLASVRSRDLEAMADDFRALVGRGTVLTNLAYVDVRGRPIAGATEGAAPDRTIDLSDRAYFQAALRGEEAISPVLLSRVDGDPIIVFSVPLRREGAFGGLLFGAVRLVQLIDMIEYQRFGQSGRFRLFDGSGRLLERSEEYPPSSLPLFDATEVRRRGALTAEVGNGNGGRALLRLHPLARSGLFIGAELDFAEINAGARRVTRAAGLVLALLGGVGTGLFFLLSRRISRSLALLTATLSATAEGLYDPQPEEVLAPLPEEFRHIGEALNGLQRRVNASIAEIRERGIRDGLTGLHNRQFFEEALHRLGRGDQDPVTAVMCDVNGLKLVNDGLGHIWGDRLLKKAADVLREVAGPEDIVARIGGDEFVLLLPRSDDARERELSERLSERLRRNGNGNGGDDDIPLFMAWGMARDDAARRNLEEVVKDADERMYARKETRRADTQRAILDVFFRKIRARERRRIDHMERCRTVMGAFLLSRPDVDAPFRDRMTRLASLHDIGIVGVDGTVVAKEGPLDADDWRAIRSHPEIGYRIASAIPHLADLAEAILHHHQRWDGRGYPFRKTTPLSGESIPLESRLMSLVDAYEAMTGRTYAPPLSHDEAIAEIRRCAGSQFDPLWAERFALFLETWQPI